MARRAVGRLVLLVACIGGASAPPSCPAIVTAASPATRCHGGRGGVPCDMLQCHAAPCIAACCVQPLVARRRAAAAPRESGVPSPASTAQHPAVLPSCCPMDPYCSPQTRGPALVTFPLSFLLLACRVSCQVIFNVIVCVILQVNNALARPSPAAK